MEELQEKSLHREQLADRGYHVEQADSGEAALERLAGKFGCETHGEICQSQGTSVITQPGQGERRLSAGEAVARRRIRMQKRQTGIETKRRMLALEGAGAPTLFD